MYMQINIYVTYMYIFIILYYSSRYISREAKSLTIVFRQQHRITYIIFTASITPILPTQKQRQHGVPLSA